MSTAPVTYETPSVSTGFGTYLGTASALLAAVGTVVAAFQSNDTATVVGGVGAISALLLTVGGRMAQAVVLAKQVAVIVKPVIDGLADEEE